MPRSIEVVPHSWDSETRYQNASEIAEAFAAAEQIQVRRELDAIAFAIVVEASPPVSPPAADVEDTETGVYARPLDTIANEYEAWDEPRRRHTAVTRPYPCRALAEAAAETGSILTFAETIEFDDTETQ